MSNWTTLFDELTRVYTHTARLLRDSEGLLAEAGLVPSHGKQTNRVGSESSDSINAPTRWFPRWVVRVFRHGGDETAVGPLAYVAVFLADEGGTANWARGSRLEEPLVTAGVMHGDGKAPMDYLFSVCTTWFWTDKREIGGAVATADFPENKWGNYHRVETFAVGLSDLRSHEDVKSRVVDPLLALFNAAKQATLGQTNGIPAG